MLSLFMLLHEKKKKIWAFQKVLHAHVCVDIMALHKQFYSANIMHGLFTKLKQEDN